MIPVSSSHKLCCLAACFERTCILYMYFYTFVVPRWEHAGHYGFLSTNIFKLHRLYTFSSQSCARGFFSVKFISSGALYQHAIARARVIDKIGLLWRCFSSSTSLQHKGMRIRLPPTPRSSLRTAAPKKLTSSPCMTSTLSWHIFKNTTAETGCFKDVVRTY